MTKLHICVTLTILDKEFIMKLLKYQDPKTKKFGMQDYPTGKIVVKCIYEKISYFSEEGLAPVKRDGKWGLIDETGKEVTKCKYDEICDFNKGFARVRMDNKWGFIDETGKEIVKCIYDETIGYLQDLALVEKDGKWGCIDKTGKEVIERKYDDYDDNEFAEKIKEYMQKRQMTTEQGAAKQQEIIASIKAEYTKKINEAYDRNASEEEIEKILKECKDALGKLIIEAKKENSRKKALKKLDDIVADATARTKGVGDE